MAEPHSRVPSLLSSTLNKMESKPGILDGFARFLFLGWMAVTLLWPFILPPNALSESVETGGNHPIAPPLIENEGSKARPTDDIPARRQEGWLAYGQPIDPDDIYVLAVGCCPPWAKTPGAACANSVDLFLDAFLRWSGVSASHSRSLLQQEATYENVCSGLQWLARATDEHKVALIYLNVHGVLYSGTYKGRTVEKSDVFVLWTEECPFATLYALWAHLWIIDEDFIARVNKIPSRRKILIVDACHPEPGGLMVMGLPDGGKAKNYGTQEETLISSALSSQLALVRKFPRACALFTWELVSAMNAGASNLLEAFARAREKTLTESRVMCRQGETDGVIPPCREQTPVLLDPHDLAVSIQRRCP